MNLEELIKYFDMADENIKRRICYMTEGLGPIDRESVEVRKFIYYYKELKLEDKITLFENIIKIIDKITDFDKYVRDECVIEYLKELRLRNIKKMFKSHNSVEQEYLYENFVILHDQIVLKHAQERVNKKSK